MATTKLGLYNGALRILNTNRLATLTDDRPERFILDDVYDDSLTMILEEGDWNFAQRSVELAASVDLEPGFGYTFAFERPDDYVRLITISGNAYYWPMLEEYIEEVTSTGDQVFLTFVSPLYLRYVSNGNNFGLNLGQWPIAFARAVEYDLAQRIASHVTSMSAQEFDNLHRMARKVIGAARAKDARAQGQEYPSPGRMVRARLGSGTISRNYWRWANY